MELFKAYRFSVFFCSLLENSQRHYISIEPFILGLAITELTSTPCYGKWCCSGAGINTSYIAAILVFYLCVVFSMSWVHSNYFMTNAVQSMVQDLRNEMSEKSTASLCLTFEHQFEIVRPFTQ